MGYKLWSKYNMAFNEPFLVYYKIPSQRILYSLIIFKYIKLSVSIGLYVPKYVKHDYINKVYISCFFLFLDLLSDFLPVVFKRYLKLYMIYIYISEISRFEEKVCWKKYSTCLYTPGDKFNCIKKHIYQIIITNTHPLKIYNT